ncbi:MAG: PEP/pyruvate-binding domain-containing protein [Elusimicrobia bacterium]|nr:PEP/pyruvate-binding domain-containing protein [Elusimicrobiota bacterium]
MPAARLVLIRKAAGLGGSRPAEEVPRFDRRFFDGRERFTRIGGGAIGGKAAGLWRSRRVLAERFQDADASGFIVEVPTLTVIATDLFEAFMDRNGLWDLALAEESDDRIADAFQKASLPAELLGDLRALIEKVHQPLAVRSSSRLEDDRARPFAGVYETKMIPNNQAEVDARFRGLTEAVKFVYASMFFRSAKNYIRAARRSLRRERMAVIIQEVVGRRHGERFYPDFSGVARSFGYYRSGNALPEDGVAILALGLGKTVVDGGLAWSYCPAYPAASAPFASARAQLKRTQLDFWAVNMGKPPAHDPMRETEYLLRCPLSEAEADGTLACVASTYDAQSDRLTPGLHGPGPRAVNFAPILVYDALPLNDLVRRLLAVAAEALGQKVEIEFAVTLGEGAAPARLGFLQMRPLAVADEFVDVAGSEMRGPGVLLASDSAMGNGVAKGIRDVVYVRPDRFEARLTGRIGAELARFNAGLMAAKRPYLLIGFGRWGSSDPGLGIPVDWGGICGARAIAEATLPDMNVDLSQGSHFFHNISSFGVGYFCVRHDGGFAVDWAWLERQRVVAQTELVRHVRLGSPLVVKVDGRTGRGVVRKGVRA